MPAHFLWVLPQTRATASAAAPAVPAGAAPQHRDPRSWSRRDSSSLPRRSQPAAPQLRAFPPLLRWGVGTESQASPTPNPPPADRFPLLPSGKSWVGKSPPSPVPCPGWDNLSPRMIPEADHCAGSFIQAEFMGKGSQAARLTTRFQTGSAGTVPRLLNTPLLQRATGHLPAATPTAGLRPPPLASAWHSWKRE